MNKKGKFSRGAGPGTSKQQGDKGNKPTHFLCFPIASDETVPFISRSIEQWREVTTRPPRKPPIRAAVSEEDWRTDDRETRRGAKDETTPNSQRATTDTFAERLKELPPTATRAAGTWHLTLGVMNLEEESQMRKALETLHGLDLQALLSDAERGPPQSHKPTRKWRDKEKDEVVATTNAGQDSTGPDQAKGKEPDDRHQQPLQPVTIALTGLGGFPSLQKARVLWARPREQVSSAASANRPVVGGSERLYNFALHLIQPFRDAGLITETRALALHATVVNMRFAKGKGKTPSWKSDQLDARSIGRVWNEFDGNVSAAGENEEEVKDDADADDKSEQQQSDSDELEEGKESDIQDAQKEFVWLKDVEVNRVAICKLGASNHEDPLWGEWYPAIENGERLVFGE